MAWRGTGLTDVGRVRPSNQDALAVLNHLGLWIVADGMGGHPGGDVASRLAVETITASIEAETGTTAHDQTDRREHEAALRRAIASANRAIRQEGIAHPHLAGMGTTVVVLHMTAGSPAHASLAHVGDSRAYLLRARTLIPLTQDHSLVEEYLRRGLIAPREALTHPMRHILTRAVGTNVQVEPDVSSHELQPDDVILLCTDGLTKMLDDGQIADTILRTDRSAETICQALVNEAIRGGGDDNVTVVVVRQECV
ncbi:MAG: Stp1/IreP family PP2C-type Ser/Thr phosphatase [Nitrospirae bacterium]|nr:Stp1/IreP family PP2C-type Ser/Thr phosphatase [Nitrospirota bacterium]